MVTKFNDKGQEIPDSTPIEIPSGYKRPESLRELVARMVQSHGLHRVESDGDETFEEANDFDMDDDDAELFPTHHELHEEVVDAQKEVNKERAEKARRRARGEEEESEEVPREADGPAVRDDLQGGRRVRRQDSVLSEEDSQSREHSQPRSAQRRRPRRREHAEYDEDDKHD